ncbi:MAG: hypothetical protein IKS41_02385 [Alphaproteobacteria bacterium]|nr:hypothetical protein [Alphaproteobacteria bacterium]
MENAKNKQENTHGQSSDKSSVKSESGRSLIEMLAVLAIIGVLVVLGLNLYWYALERYRTNALKAELGSMAITTSIKLSTSSNFKINGNLKYPFEGKFNDDQTFTITVSSIPFKICSRLRSEDWALPSEILINGAQRGPCRETNTLAFSFNNSVYDGKHPELEPSSPSGGSSTSPKDPCRPCSEGCEKTCKTDRYWCWGDGCACFNGKIKPPVCRETGCSSALVPIMDCEGDVTYCCPDTFKCTQPTCCKSDWVTVTDCDGRKTQCCPDDGNDCSSPECCADGWVDIHNCDGTTTKCCPKKEGDCAQPSCCSQAWVKVTDCEGNVTDCCPDDGRDCSSPKCCNADWITVTNCDGTTTQCCPDDGNDCSNPACCTAGWVTVTNCNGTTTQCCPDGGNVCEDETDCCGNASDCSVTGQVCVDNHCTCPSNQYRGKHAYGNTKCTSGECCYGCDDSTKTFATEAECDLCSGRAYMPESGQCILRNDGCEPGKTFAKDDGTCKPCTDGSIHGSLEADCLSCNEGQTIPVRSYTIKKSNGTPTCIKGACPAQKFITDINLSSCKDCTDPTPYVTTAWACATCGNLREYNSTTQKCSLATTDTCESDEFKNNSSVCIPCSQQTTDNMANWLSTQTECDKCSSNRKYEGGYCLPKCESGYFENTLGNCVSCSESIYFTSDKNNWKSTKASCDRCTDHYHDGTYCLPNCPSGYFKNENGICVPCSELIFPTGYQSNWKTSQSECINSCPDRRYDGTYCVPKCPDGYFQNANGNCTDCGLKAGKATSQANCEVCGNWNSTFTRTYSGGKCSLPTCPGGTFQCDTTIDTTVCRLCSDSGEYTSTTDYCSACNKQDGEGNYLYKQRKMVGNKCVLQ